MNTILTTIDVKNILQNIIEENNNYIAIKNEDNGIDNVRINDYLNLELYAWKNRLVGLSGGFVPYDEWVDTLNLSMNKSYGLVELQESNILASKDIESATLSSLCTVVISSSKVEALEYYILQLRAKYTGVVQDIINSNGDKLKAYLTFGILKYDGEPTETQLGETIECSFMFGIEYLTDSVTYEDLPIYLKVNNTYYQVPYTKLAWMISFVGEQVSLYKTPNRTGQINQVTTMSVNFSLFDFNKALYKELDAIFFSVCASKIGGVSNTSNKVNYPVKLKVVKDGVDFEYNMLITNMTKDFENSSFITSALTLLLDGRNQ